MVIASGDLIAKLQKHHLLKVETATERQAEAFGLSLPAPSWRFISRYWRTCCIAVSVNHARERDLSLFFFATDAPGGGLVAGFQRFPPLAGDRKARPPFLFC
jgi:hypothetical protein